MANVRSTVIMKTDLCGFTARVRTLPESDLAALLREHKLLTLPVIQRQEGSVIKGEGDSYWATFPSVTAAALAAVEIQQELRAAQAAKSEDDRLAIRMAITLGDVLHQEGDIFGDAVNLAARIESVTPPDEIYLSQAAWLALNKAEIGTGFVNEFSLKGMSVPERIYRIDQRHKTRVVRGQVLVATDLRDFTAYNLSHTIEDVESLLTRLEDVIKTVCEQHGGTLRMVIGDACFLTFPTATPALAAAEQLVREWRVFRDSHEVPCSLSLAIHRGDLFIFRSYIYGEDINYTVHLESLSRQVYPDSDTETVFVSDSIRQEVEGSTWAARMRQIDPGVVAVAHPKLRERLENEPIHEVVVG